MKKIKKIRLNEIPNDVFIKLNIIDVREVYEFANYSIPGSNNIPLNTFISMAPFENLDKNEIYYFVCQAGIRSEIAAEKFQEHGFKAINLIVDWKKFV